MTHPDHPDQADQPDWLIQLQDAVGGFTDVLERVRNLFVAQGAMGWAYQGEFDKAREQLASLDHQQLGVVSMAARALAQLADEQAART